MKNIRLEHDQLPDSTIQMVANRDAALWIAQGTTVSDEALANLVQFIGLPWKLVLCEMTDANLIAALDRQQEDYLTRQRGFIHVVASDPEGFQLPPRALPVFFLNGRQKPTRPEESSSLGAFGGLRRRLNMMAELVAARPQLVVLVSDGQEQPINDFLTLWRQENFRSYVVLLSTADRDVSRIDLWLTEPSAAPAVDHCRAPLKDILPKFLQGLAIELPGTRSVIRVRNENGAMSNLDITDCDLIDRPLLNNYDIIGAKDLTLLQPSELSRIEFEGFFSRSMSSWKPYAAGLPWRKNGQTVSKKILDRLKLVSEQGPTENRIISAISESGAGGTTFARMMAFEAASQGFPTLVARPSLVQAEALELSSFLHRVHLKAIEEGLTQNFDAKNPSAKSDQFEVPWLVVFDVNHWDGKQAELRTFMKALTGDRRPVVILVINGPFVPADFSRTGRIEQIASLTHELTLPEAQQLGEHLNKFLRQFGEERSAAEWRHFWEAHRPDNINVGVAHFWIALEFWIKRQFDLSQSIQSWLYGSFRKTKMDDDLRLLLLEIAALTIERQPLPEGLMPSSPKHKYPYSALLEEIRITTPALALVRESSDVQKVWAMAHDLLGRYLITSTFFDHQMLEQLGLQSAKNAVQLRLSLLRRIASREALALKPFRGLALNFVIKILKLDSTGNQEFILHWREVLEILMSMPSALRETSRVFNHHVAVSLRRVVKHAELNIPLEERKELLNRAIKHLEYALNELKPELGEEPNLNLFTSLALAYQDLADVEREAGAIPERIEQLRAKATEATRRALEEDPTDSYVLETMAKNLIQNGELYPKEAAVSATEALVYIYQAVTLERSEFRQTELTRLANRAVQLLRSANAKEQTKRLTDSGNPLGALAEAWLVLTEGIDNLNKHDISHLPLENVNNAIAVLDNTQQNSHWMLIRFRYDLVSTSRPSDFETQLRLLDELEGTGYRMPLQIELEHAILLHQKSRSAEANKKFHFIRREIHRSNTIVEVPSRLYWLRGDAKGGLRICEAQVVELHGRHSMAKVYELNNEMAPFVPQEFGIQAMRPREVFKCAVSFGRNGPFLRPPLLETEK